MFAAFLNKRMTGNFACFLTERDVDHMRRPGVLVFPDKNSVNRKTHPPSFGEP